MNTKPRGLTNDELRTAMAALRSIPRHHRGWCMQEIVAELQHTSNINEAIASAIDRLQESAE